MFFYLVKKVSSFGVVLLAERALKIAEKVFLFAVKSLGNLNNYAHILIALSSSSQMREASAFELENVVRLGAFMDRVFYVALKRGNDDLGAERRLSECKGQIAPNVVASALKHGVAANLYINMKVACGASVVAGVAVTADVEYLLIPYARGDSYVNGAVLALSSRAAALAAGIVNYFTRAVAGVAGALSLNNAEGRALVYSYPARAAARRAGLGLTACRSACAVAFVAG